MKIREYSEGLPVEIQETTIETHNIDRWKDRCRLGEKRLVILALCEAGWVGVGVDLLDVLEWVKENKPELLTLCSETSVLKQ